MPGILTSDLVATSGIVSALAGPRNNVGLIQISAPVQPGNSGGPVLDESGYVVGVVVAKLDALRIAGRTGDVPQNVNFSISLAVLKDFLNANRVAFGAGLASKPIPISQVVDEARGYTYPVACAAL